VISAVETPKNLMVCESSDGTAPSPFTARTSTAQSTMHALPPLYSSTWQPRLSPDLHSSDHLQAKWSNCTRLDLENLHEDARNLALIYRLEESEAKYREALEGSQLVLPLDHEVALAVAYSLAKFYAHCDRMSNANAVLDWLGKRNI
jgi:hypothetical protein